MEEATCFFNQSGTTVISRLWKETALLGTKVVKANMSKGGNMFDTVKSYIKAALDRDPAAKQFEVLMLYPEYTL